jgi:dTDP-4-dehydrorhamnose reductase
MRLLVTGTNGEIGWERSRRLELFGEVIPLRRDECDFAQPARLPTIIRRMGPDVIINAAAYTAVDKAEQQQELAFAANGASVGTIAEEARRASAFLIHYSTEYASGMGACSDPLRGGDITMKGY